MDFCRPIMSARVTGILSTCLGICLSCEAQEPVLFKEVSSREFSVHIGGVQPLPIQQLSSREVGVYVAHGSLETIAQGNSREVSVVLASPEPPPRINNLTLEPSPTGIRLKVSWEDYNQWEVKDIIRFDVYVSKKHFTNVVGLTPIKSVPFESVAVSIDGLPEWTDEFIAVVPVDAAGQFLPDVSAFGAYVLSPRTSSREFSLFIGADGLSPYAESVSRETSVVIDVENPPRAIDTLVREVSPSGSTVKLSWEGYNEYLERDVARYDVYYSPSPFNTLLGMKSIAAVPAETFSVILTNLPVWQDHSFVVVPVDALGHYLSTNSSFGVYVISPQAMSREFGLFIGSERSPSFFQAVSREVTTVFADTNVPAPVTGIQSGFTATKSETGYRSVDLDWSSYNEPLQRDVVRYRVYVGTKFFDSVDGMDPFAYLPAENLRYTLPGLFSDHVYFFAVVAEDAAGRFDGRVRSTIAQAANRSIWRRLYFTPKELADPNLEPKLWGNEADPDGDQIPNLLEYALGGDLRVASTLNFAGSAPLLPFASIQLSQGDAYLAVHYRQRQNADDLGLVYRWLLSANLVDWIPSNTPNIPWTYGHLIETLPETGMNGFDSVAFRLDKPIAELPSTVFGKLDVSISESSVTPYSKAVKDSRPASYWRFDDLSLTNLIQEEITGSATTSGTGLELTQRPHPKRGYAARMKETELTSTELITQHQSGAFALEVWILSETNASLSQEEILYSESGLSLLLDPEGKFELRLLDNLGAERFFRSSFSIMSGVWHHVVIQMEPGGCTLWVDGKQALTSGPIAEGLKITTTKSTKTSVTIGSSGIKDANAFTGFIDELAVYTRLLTKTEIDSHIIAGSR